MSRFVDKLPFFDRRASPMEEADDIPRSGLLHLHGGHHHYQHHHQPQTALMAPEPSPPTTKQSSSTLAQLLKRVNDARSDASSPNSSPSHYTIELGASMPGSTGSESEHTSLTGVGVGVGDGTLLPFVLKFTDLTYSVKQRKKGPCLPALPFRRGDAEPEAPRMKTLLDNVSGEAREGEIMAVLGASGSGKSTLIDALANRIRKESLHGSVTLNGESMDNNLLKVISAYVMQDDLLYPMLTVEETLMFSAEFRLPRSLPTKEKKKRVQALIDQLGLRNAANTIIGDEGHRGVSGGERRRVSIGVDIIHDPIVLFLDEPTSGLDSTSAFMVVKVLQRIAQSGSVVVMSIHQPSYRILGLLDRLLFLSRGQTVYYGPPGSLSSFFSDFGKPIHDNENPTEFALDLVRELETMPNGACDLVEHNKSWQKRMGPKMKHADDGNGGKPSLSLQEAISASISRGKLVSGATDGNVTVPSPSSAPASTVAKFANPFWIEMGVLTRRAFLNTKRTPEIFVIRLGAVLITGFILATIFWRLDDSPKGVEERLGFFAIAMSTMFYTCSDALPVFLNERYIFLRETAYNAYRRSSYVLSHTIVGFPSLIVLSLAFAVTTFFAVGLAGGAEGFFFFVAIVLASFWAGSGFATFLSGVVTNVQLGFPVVVSTLAYFLLFSGFFINRDRIPKYWLWFHYASLVKYPYEAVMINEFSDPGRCFVRGVQMFDNTPLSVLPPAIKVRVLRAMSSSLGINIGTATCITTGPDFLKQQAVTDLTKWDCLWITVAWGFLFRILFYISLLLGSRNKRR
ncbi:ABC transporter G family member 5-like [Triticum dicoccoides]|uniref:ABC transporter G family member 5-like n=1 Tax=Triticum dicoccoides TaxID=85692 RepID=UPI000E7CA5D0|nr:ABC transporter G family member 5-like [Triticum dicoccoides]